MYKRQDLGTLLEAGLGAQVEPLVPTVRVEQTLDDYLAGRDTLVDWLLANGADYTAPEPVSYTHLLSFLRPVILLII